jgi:type I restriction enzyme S subunit
MREGWEFKILGDVLAELRNGVNCKQDKNGAGDKISRIESISSADFDIAKVGFSKLSELEKEKYKLHKGDILFSHINSPIHVGKTALFNCDEDVYHGVNLLLMRPKPFLRSDYLELYLKFLFQNGFWKNLCKQAVNQASVNQKDINKVEISYPKSLLEQQRIVSILDEAFAAIDKVKANAEKNLVNSNELFESYLQGVFENKGDGWLETSLKEVCAIGDGNYSSKYPKASEFVNKGVPFLTATNLKNGTIVPDSIRYITEEQHKSLTKGHVIKGDLVIVVRGSSTGNNSILPEKYSNSNLNSQLAFLRVNPSILTSEYLFLAFNSPMFKISLRAAISGAAQPQLPNNKLLDLLIPYPPILVQKVIVEKLDSISAETNRLESIYQQKLIDLEELKKSILQKAFNGELNITKICV